MPCNGDVNRRFGIYKSACCGAEIVIPENATFPIAPHTETYPQNGRTSRTRSKIPERQFDSKKATS
jgi:hypothetical protein